MGGKVLSQRSVGGYMGFPKNDRKSNFHHGGRHWQFWNTARSTQELLRHSHLLILAVLPPAWVPRKETLTAGLWGECFPGTEQELTVCILKMVLCSIFTSSLFPARMHRKQVYSHLSFSAVLSQATCRNLILLLQLLSIFPWRICPL